MSFKNKLIAVVASAALCASFVPVLAIADLVDEEKSLESEDVELVAQGEDDGEAADAQDDVAITAQAEDEGEGAVELTTQATAGTLVFTGATGVSGNTLSYEGGYKVELSYGSGVTGTWDSTKFELSLSDDATVTFKFTSPDGYSGNASLTIDGTQYAFDGGQCTYTTTFSSKTGITIEFDPGVGSQETRNVTVTIDKASEPMLSVDKCRFTVGYGDKNDVEYTKNGSTVAVDAATRQKIILGFAITNKYFIPTVVVNGKTYETTDTGTSSDPSVANLCVELTGDDANVDTFDINLSIGAVATIDLSAQSIVQARATYMTVDEGRALMSDITADVGLSVADTSLDAAVDGAVATFDLDASVNSAAVTELESPLDVTMLLDTSVYTASDYVVVSNHEGTLTELATEYDAATGRLTFPASQFSDYSLVDKNATSASTKGTSASATAKTGDPLSAAGMAIVALAALGLVVFAIRKVRE